MENLELLVKPLWQMTGAEFLELNRNALTETAAAQEAAQAAEKDTTPKEYVYGMKGIAKIFGCSIATACRIKASGKLEGAYTQVGRKIIVDKEKALQVADYRYNPNMRRTKKQ